MPVMSSGAPGRRACPAPPRG